MLMLQWPIIFNSTSELTASNVWTIDLGLQQVSVGEKERTTALAPHCNASVMALRPFSRDVIVIP